MRHALQWLLSLLFVIQMYVAIIVLMVGYVPLALFTRTASLRWMQLYGRWVRFTAEHMVGLRTEIRGPIPTGAVLVASKHQSFLDSVVLVSTLPAPRFIMKKELTWVPVAGWHALRAGFVPVDRGKRGSAIKQMLADVEKGALRPGQIIIYPQGTRVAAGAQMPYKSGSAALYAQLKQPCIPVATNVGVFWPRHGIYRKPGVAVIEFLPAIPAGMRGAAFMQVLEETIETASNRLMREAGFNV
ncbi:lysophospholipid acyltransferase family protein [Rhodobacter ferrooxidans]|uniref:Phospholipid/glycerol acyltransferase n=1 Tax=Rhodobacter ferrooxidans TaxID=371731 RepID=C8S2C7_9RHOB|nr:lysophospholipid acyltransferase family protein [Rhodobacter sp. SW2]EEW24798.1 phospholipid/glycerol acyltransferase [Rhodobacter sp. SW2]